MTDRGHRFLHVSRKSGAFVLLAALALVAVLLLTARAQRWFERTIPFEVRLPEAGSFGLRAGSSVELLGTGAGVVDDLRIDAAGVMWARIAVREDFARFIGGDSRCTVKKKTFDLAGDAYLEITRGTTAPVVPGTTLVANAARGLTEEFGTVVQELGQEMTPTIRELRAAVQAYAELARKLQDPDGRVQQAFARVESITRSIDSGQGLAGRLLSDPALADEVDQITVRVRDLLIRLDETFARVDDDLVGSAQKASALLGDLADAERGVPALLKDVRSLLDQLGGGQRSLPALVGDVRALLEELRPIVTDLRATISPLPAITEAARDQIGALPGLVASTQANLLEAERLLVAVQRHWLLAPYVAPSAPTGRLGGEGIGGDK